MKTVFFLFLISASSYAAECRLTGILKSDKTLETSLSTETSLECEALAKKSQQNDFFGLIEENDELIETTMSFEEDN